MKPTKPLLLRNCAAGRPAGHRRVDFRIILKSLIIWVLIIPLAIVNGIMRQSMLEPLMGKCALPVSGITLCAMIFALCWFLVPRLGWGSQKTYMAVGACWVVLAAAVECLMGIFLLEASWHAIMNAYNPASGNLWWLVLVCIGISPCITAKKHT